MSDVTRLCDDSDLFSHKLGMQDPNWRQCVYDHRKQLLENSTQVNFSLEHAHQWRYRLQEFINVKYNLPYDVVWIVFWLNNLQNPDHDGGVLKLYVPHYDYLTKLYNAMSSNTLYT